MPKQFMPYHLEQFYAAVDQLVGEINQAAPAIVKLGKRQSHFRYYEFSPNVNTPRQLKVELSGLSHFLSHYDDTNIQVLIESINRLNDYLGNIDFDLIPPDEFSQRVSRLRTCIDAAIKPIGKTSNKAGWAAAPTPEMPGSPKILFSRKPVAYDADFTAGAAGINIEKELAKFRARHDLSAAAPAAVHDGDTASEPPTNPAMQIKLSDDNNKARGQAVECDAKCKLTIDWSKEDKSTLVTVHGETLKKAREQELEVTFILYRGKFRGEDQEMRIKTKFVTDGFESPIVFNLTAPNSSGSSDLWLEMEIKGLPFVRIRLELLVVDDIGRLSESEDTSPLPFDLDRVIDIYKKIEPPAAILEINSTANPPYVRLVAHGLGNDVIHYHARFAQASIANKLQGIARDINSNIAAKDDWNLLNDPLYPTNDELKLLAPLYPLPYMAQAGNDLYNWLVGDPSDEPQMSEILRFIDQLENGSRITIRSNSIAIPWEIIYPEPCSVIGNTVYGQASSSKFWGYRFIFETLQSPGIYDLPNGDIALNHPQQQEKKLTVIVNSDIGLDNNLQYDPQVSAQRTSFDNAKNEGSLQKLSVGDKCPDAVNLITSETEPGQMVYFYCHGGAEQPYTASEVLQVAKGCDIAVRNVLPEPQYTGAPIVFLNSCSSAALSDVSFDSFCSRFLLKGAQGLVATSFQMPIRFAARFGCDLVLRYMKAEGTIGEILLDMRRQALDKQIPLGLFYMLRCPSNANLKQSI